MKTRTLLAGVLSLIVAGSAAAGTGTYYVYEVLHHFTGGADGGGPSGLVEHTPGVYWGVTSGGGDRAGSGTVFRFVPGQAPVTKHVFNLSEGMQPGNKLVSVAGALYGTTSIGGDFTNGTVFSISDSSYSVVHHITNDEGWPVNGPLISVGGYLYGVTGGYGALGGGTVFRADPKTGAGVVMHNYPKPDGYEEPQGPLVRHGNGLLYGTTASLGNYTTGTAFSLNTKGVYQTRHSFGPFPEGNEPVTGLSLDASGELLGATSYGGLDDRGTVFKMTPTGQVTVLHDFQDGVDGWLANTAMVLSSNGTAYGTTFYAHQRPYGEHSGCGSIFYVTSSGLFKTWWLFDDDWDESKGCHLAGITPGSDGHFYGTMVRGGSTGHGVIFRLRKVVGGQ